MWGLPPSDTVLHILSLVALAAQAMSAALAAGRRSMDWMGVCFLGCITALGGGTIRDVVLGHYPLPWVENPSYLAITAIAAFATVLLARTVHRLNLAFLVLDAIGLVVFTMTGCDVAWQLNEPLAIVIVSGMITSRAIFSFGSSRWPVMRCTRRRNDATERSRTSSALSAVTTVRRPRRFSPVLLAGFGAVAGRATPPRRVRGASSSSASSTGRTLIRRG